MALVYHRIKVLSIGFVGLQYMSRVFDILASKKSLQAAPGFIFLSNLNFLLARYG